MRAPSPPRPSCRSRSSGDRTPTRATCMGRVGTYSVLAANDLPNLSTLAPITRALGLRLRLWRSGLGRNHVQVAGASSPPHASSPVGLAAVPFHGRLDNAARIVEYCPSSADRKSAKNRTGLCARVAVATSLSNADAAAAAGALFSAIADVLARDDTVTIAGFRNFTIRDRPARTTRNPKIGEAVAIAASRAPLFKAGKTLRDAVKMVSVPVRSNPRCPQLPCHRTSTAARRGGSSDSPRTRADTPALNFRCFLIACAPSITGPAPTVTGGMTRGFRRARGGYRAGSTPKKVFVRALTRHARRVLRSPTLEPRYRHGRPRAMLSAMPFYAMCFRAGVGSVAPGFRHVWGRHDHRRSAESPSQPCDRSCGSTGPRERRRRRPSPAPPGNHRACPATAALGGSNHRPPWACVPPDCACVRSGWNSSAFRTLSAPRRLDSTDESSASGHLPLWAHGSKVEFDVSDYGFPEQGRQIA